VTGVGAVPPQTFWVIDTSGSSLSWLASVHTISGPGNWLSVTPGAGVAAAAPNGASPIVVSVNSNGLAAGIYEGQIDVSTADHTSASSVTVLLNVLAQGSTPPPLVRPTGIVFSAAAGTNPGSQGITVSNLSGRTISFASGQIPQTGAWFAALPGQASIAPGQAQTLTVQTNASSSPAGISRGAITFLFDDGSVQTVTTLLVATPAVSAPATSAQRPLAGTGACTPTTLLGAFTSLQEGSALASGQPATIGARITDDCGHPLETGAVQVQFGGSDSEAPLALNPTGNGYWEASWVPPPASGVIPVQLIAGDGTLITQVNVNSTTSVSAIPVIYRGGVVSAADPFPLGPIAAGGFIAIYGSGLAETTIRAGAVPLPSTLGGVQVLLGGQPLPLLYVSPAQIDAVVPYDASVGVPSSIQVLNGGLQSLPETVVVSSAQPAIFILPQFGPAQAAVVGSGGLAIPQSPVTAGDRITIYCEGLGPVAPVLTAGNLVPSDRLYRTTGAVSVSIGGQPATVEFSGLAPGSVGEYQINAVVPADIITGDAVPVVISVGGATSLAATIALR
jgi:uncharacterized protein (TIGR03437 family)